MQIDVKSARISLERKAESNRQRRIALAAEAEADAQAIISMLITKYAPKRIYRWGSLLNPERFHEWSDIDLALEGLTDPMEGLHALDDACRLTRFPVDLVELERIHPEHAKTIRQQGIMIYER
ncbi:hypothetical protein [Desulfonatronospira sp.]|uniref:nucleotidyltransferase family protein n=1 Tax=Desulfonatronospira sp. TaxID=1962951 RepID=UPI0025B993A9|nr:hypothetical protein [Desulfonatronospira sp.]